MSKVFLKYLGQEHEVPEIIPPPEEALISYSLDCKSFLISLEWKLPAEHCVAICLIAFAKGVHNLDGDDLNAWATAHAGKYTRMISIARETMKGIKA